MFQRENKCFYLCEIKEKVEESIFICYFFLFVISRIENLLDWDVQYAAQLKDIFSKTCVM